MIDHDLIKRLINYDPETGITLWRARAVDMFTDNDRHPAQTVCNQWNGKHAGQIVGSVNPGGHVEVKLFGKSYKLARVIWLYMTGEWPSLRVNHRNDSLTDNRWENLRLANHTQSGSYKRTYSRTGAGLRGAYPTHRRGNSKPWRASIHIDGKRLHLGVYDTELEAHHAYVAAAKYYYDDFARVA
jgi:hypothetical protein